MLRPQAELFLQQAWQMRGWAQQGDAWSSHTYNGQVFLPGHSWQNESCELLSPTALANSTFLNCVSLCHRMGRGCEEEGRQASRPCCSDFVCQLHLRTPKFHAGRIRKCLPSLTPQQSQSSGKVILFLSLECEELTEKGVDMHKVRTDHPSNSGSSHRGAPN